MAGTQESNRSITIGRPQAMPGAANATPGFSTLALRAGYDPADHLNASSVPIYATAAYALHDEEHATAIASFESADDIYSRISNPTTGVLEKRLAALHGAAGAVATASGLAALSNAILNAAAGGGRILTSYRLYGGSVAALRDVLPDLGIGIDIVPDPDNLDSWESSVTDSTRAIVVESVSNPLTVVADLEALAQIAHRHGIILIVDNTLATPYLLNPFDFGADVVVYSTTKAINGHGNAIGGIVLESGRFDYANGNYPQFTRKQWFFKDRALNPRSVIDVAPAAPFTTRLRGLLVTLLGAAPSPFDSYLTLIGLEMLKQRVTQEVATAEQIVKHLEADPRVTKVYHPSASGYEYKELAAKYLPRGGGSVLTFEVRGDDALGAAESTVVDAAENTAARKRAVLDALKLFSLQANLGDSKSLAVDPVVVTHGELDTKQLREAGITGGAIRLSIGLEEPDDLIADLDQALDQAFGEAFDKPSA